MKETFIEDTRNIIHRYNDTSVKVGTLGPHTVLPAFSSTVQNTLQNPLLELPSAAPSYFPESHLQSEIFSLSKVILVLGKARVTRYQIWAVQGLSRLGDLIFHQNTA